MRLQRLLVGIAGGALLGALPVALATSPASAGVTATASRVQGAWYKAPDGNNIWRYGQNIRLEAQVFVECSPEDEVADLNCPPVDETGDTVALQRRMWGSATWRTLSTKEVGSAMITFNTTSVGSAVYQMVYSGGTSAGYDTSGAITLKLNGSRNPGGRALITSSGAAYYRGNVNPGWGGRYVTVQKKTCLSASCPWRTFRTVKTSRTGGYSVRIQVPRTGRFDWRSTVPADSPRYVKGFGNVYYTVRGRVPARTVPGS